MSKILMRMAMSPFDNCSLFDVVSKDRIGTNSGNMLFPYGIMRNIYSSDDTIDGYASAKEKDAEWINANYDMFIIPLANAFRDSFVGELRNLTKLIKRLTIPCVVVGVGMQANYEPDFNKKNAFDDATREFVSAVLEKSNSIGVRGEITANYLKRLGFAEEKIDVIGCPSMFMWGKDLPRKIQKDLTEETRISMNYHGNFDNYFLFLERCKKNYKNYFIILQKIYDLRLLYAGDTIREENHHRLYVKSVDNRSFYENHMRMFINVPSWIEFLSDNVDFGVGSCIHGSVASVMAGNPTFVFAADSRVRELAEWHNIPMARLHIIDENLSLEDIFEKYDFNSVLKGHKDRYDIFRRFLKKNGIQCKEISGKNNTDFDKKMNTIDLHCKQGVEPYIFRPLEEQIESLNKYLSVVEGKIQWWIREEKKNSDVISGRIKWEQSKECVLNRLENL